MGVQRDLGWKLLADVAYVGSKGRRLLQTRNLNGRAVRDELPAVQSGPDDRRAASPDDLLRPYRGYGDILLSEFAGFSDYDSLQSAINRRYSRGLRFGVSYTLSNAKNVGGTTGTVNPTVNPFLDDRARNYAFVGRRHNLMINYSYDVPGLSKKWDTAVVRGIFDNWQISGGTSALSGATLPLTYSISGVSDLTGGAGAGADSRVDIICDPNLSRGDRSPTRRSGPSASRRLHCRRTGSAPPSATRSRARVSELGHHVREERSVRWEPPVHLPMRAL